MFMEKEEYGKYIPLREQFLKHLNNEVKKSNYSFKEKELRDKIREGIQKGEIL